MVSKEIDGVPLVLARDFDLAALRDYGTVFAVFDQQDSGNLCFGLRDGDKKWFVKLAGASTVRSNVTPEAAVARLISTIPTYEALAHPTLINLQAHRPIPGGHLAVFDWFDGDCMGKQYGLFDQFLALPVDEKRLIYAAILDFHLAVCRRGYVAIDFYDGCIMYNGDTKETRLCDIEFYAKAPVMNTMGRMWGSGRYMSPEEFTLGAALDEVTTVFTMGATAFQLFGGGLARDRDEWHAGEACYRAALRAVSESRADRFPSLRSYCDAWYRAAK